MVLALKSHLHNHKLSSNPFSTIVRSQQAPLFVQPIQTSSLSPLHLKTRRKSLKGFNASYVESLERSDNNNNGGRGGGVTDKRKDRGGDGDGGRGVNVGEVVRLFLRFAELLMGRDPVLVGAVGLPAKLALLCVQAMWQLHLALREICAVAVLYTCVGVLLISAVVTFLFFQFV